MNAVGINLDDYGAVSSYDLGLMQLNTWSFHLKNWADIDENLDVGCKYLKECLIKGHNQFAVALFIYNCGENAYIHNHMPETTYIYIGKVLTEKSRIYNI